MGMEIVNVLTQRESTWRETYYANASDVFTVVCVAFTVTRQAYALFTQEESLCTHLQVEQKKICHSNIFLLSHCHSPKQVTVMKQLTGI